MQFFVALAALMAVPGHVETQPAANSQAARSTSPRDDGLTVRLPASFFVLYGSTGIPIYCGGPGAAVSDTGTAAAVGDTGTAQERAPEATSAPEAGAGGQDGSANAAPAQPASGSAPR